MSSSVRTGLHLPASLPQVNRHLTLVVHLAGNYGSFFNSFLLVSSVVHALRPADIKVVAAIGDSLTVIIHIYSNIHCKSLGVGKIY